MTNITICPMSGEKDMLGKAYVHYKSWHETYTELVDESYMRTVTLEKCEAIARKYPDGLIVAKDGDKAVGFAGYGPYRDDTLPSCGEVYSIYILKEYQAKKIGLSLMNAAIDRLNAYSRIALWVLDGNERAIRFYEKYGFRFDGTCQEILFGTPRTERRMVYERPERL